MIKALKNLIILMVVFSLQQSVSAQTSAKPFHPEMSAYVRDATFFTYSPGKCGPGTYAYDVGDKMVNRPAGQLPPELQTATNGQYTFNTEALVADGYEFYHFSINDSPPCGLVANDTTDGGKNRNFISNGDSYADDCEDLWELHKAKLTSPCQVLTAYRVSIEHDVNGLNCKNSQCKERERRNRGCIEGNDYYGQPGFNEKNPGCKTFSDVESEIAALGTSPADEAEKQSLQAILDSAPDNIRNSSPPWIQNAWIFNCVENKGYHPACGDELANDGGCYWRALYDNVGGGSAKKICASCDPAGSAGDTRAQMKFEIIDVPGCKVPTVEAVDGSGNHTDVSCPECYAVRDPDTFSQSEWPEDVDVISQGCHIKESVVNPGDAIGLDIFDGFLDNGNGLFNDLPIDNIRLSMPDCLLESAFEANKPKFDQFEHYDVDPFDASISEDDHTKMAAEAYLEVNDTYFGKDPDYKTARDSDDQGGIEDALEAIDGVGTGGTSGVRTTEWKGNCGRGLFFYHDKAPRDSNLFLQRPPSDDARIGDSMVWEGKARTGCYNPEERFAILPPKETYFRDATGIGAAGTKDPNDGRILFFEPVYNKEKTSHAISGPRDETIIEGAPSEASAYLIPNDRLLMEHPLCTARDIGDLNYVNPVALFTTFGKTRTYPLSAGGGIDFNKMNIDKEFIVQTLQTARDKEMVSVKGDLPKCLIEQEYSDMNDFCSAFLQNVHSPNVTINFLGQNMSVSSEKIMPGRYTSSKYFFDYDSFCWKKADKRAVLAFDPYERWMPLAIRSQIDPAKIDLYNPYDPSNPDDQSKRVQDEDKGGLYENQKEFIETDYRRPTFTEYAERQVYQHSDDEGRSEVYSLEEYGYRDQPHLRVDYQFNPTNIYNPSKAPTVPGNDPIPPEVLLMDNFVGRKYKMNQCLRIYLEQWAFQLDKGIVALDYNKKIQDDVSGNIPRDASMCQWVAYHDVSENYVERRNFKDFLGFFLNGLVVKDGTEEYKGTDLFPAPLKDVPVDVDALANSPTKDPLGRRAVGGKDLIKTSCDAAGKSQKIKDLGLDCEDRLNYTGFKRKTGMRAEAFDYFNFLTFSNLATQRHVFDAEKFSLSSWIDLQDGFRTSSKVTNTSFVKPLGNDLYQVVPDSSQQLLKQKFVDLGPLGSVGGTLANQFIAKIENKINFAKRECNTVIPPNFSSDVIRPFQSCDPFYGARAINQFDHILAKQLLPPTITNILDKDIISTDGGGKESFWSKIGGNRKDYTDSDTGFVHRHYLTTLPDTPVISFLTPVIALPTCVYLFNKQDGLVFKCHTEKFKWVDPDDGSVTKSPIEIRDNWLRDGGQGRMFRHMVQPGTGNSLYYHNATLGMVVLDEKNFSKGSVVPRSRRWVSHLMPARSCMHFIDKPKVTATSLNAYRSDVIPELLEFKDPLKRNEDGFPTADPDDLIKDGWSQYDDLRVDLITANLKTILDEIEYIDTTYTQASPSEKEPQSRDNRMYGGFKVYEEEPFYYEWLPNKWSMGVGYYISMWCEFDLPYNPYFSGEDEYDFNKKDLWSFYYLNAQKVVPTGGALLGGIPTGSDDFSRKNKPNLQYYRVESIRNTCGPFGVRSTWLDKSDTSLVDWLIGDYNEAYKHESVCSKWFETYRREVNDPKIISWRLPRFNYEFLKAFLECTGPIMDTPPPVCKLNEGAYGKNVKNGNCEITKALVNSLAILVPLAAGSDVSDVMPAIECVGGASGAVMTALKALTGNDGTADGNDGCFSKYCYIGDDPVKPGFLGEITCLNDVEDAISSVTQVVNGAIAGFEDISTLMGADNESGENVATHITDALDHISDATGADIASLPLSIRVAKLVSDILVSDAHAQAPTVKTIPELVMDLVGVIPAIKTSISSSVTIFTEIKTYIESGSSPDLGTDESTLLEDLQTQILAIAEPDFAIVEATMVALLNSMIDPLKDALAEILGELASALGDLVTELGKAIGNSLGKAVASGGGEWTIDISPLGDRVKASLATIKGIIVDIPKDYENVELEQEKILQEAAIVAAEQKAEQLVGLLTTVITAMQNDPALSATSSVLVNTISLATSIDTLWKTFKSTKLGIQTYGALFKKDKENLTEDAAAIDGAITSTTEIIDGVEDLPETVQDGVECAKGLAGTVEDGIPYKLAHEMILDNLLRALDYGSRGDFLYPEYDKDEDCWNCDASGVPNWHDPVKEEKGTENWQGLLGADDYDTHSVSVKNFWRRKDLTKSSETEGDTPFGFWCKCPPDLGGIYPSESGKTTRCREDLCTCDQHVFLPGRYVWPIAGQLTVATLLGMSAKISTGNVDDVGGGETPEPGAGDDVGSGAGGKTPAILGMALTMANSAIKPVAVCQDYGPYRYWRWCYEQAVAKSCPVVTREVSDSIPYSTLKDPYPELKSETSDAKSKAINVSEYSQKGAVFNVCIGDEDLRDDKGDLILDDDGDPVNDGRYNDAGDLVDDWGIGNANVEGYIRWQYEEPNHLARLPVWFQSAGDGYAHEDLVFQSQVRDYDYPFMELAVPFPIDLITRDCLGFTDGKCNNFYDRWKKNANTDKARAKWKDIFDTDSVSMDNVNNIGEILQREGLGYNTIYKNSIDPANVDPDNPSISWHLGGNPESPMTDGSDAPKEALISVGSQNLNRSEEPPTSANINEDTVQPYLRNEFLARGVGLKSNLLKTKDVARIEPSPDDPSGCNKRGDCESKAYKNLYQKYIKGLYAAHLGYGHRAGAEEPGNPTFVEKEVGGVKVRGTDSQNIHPRAQDTIIGPRCGSIGGWYEMMLYQARCIKWFKLNCICDYDKNFAKGSAEKYVLRRAGAEFPILRPEIAGPLSQTENLYTLRDNSVTRDMDGEIIKDEFKYERKSESDCQILGGVYKELPNSISNDGLNKDGYCLYTKHNTGKLQPGQELSKIRLDENGYPIPVLTTGSGSNKTDNKHTINIKKAPPISFPLVDRGFLGPEYAAKNTEAWPNATNNGNETNKFKFKGLDNTKVGDIIIWDEEILYGETIDVGYPRHAAYVERVDRPLLDTLGVINLDKIEIPDPINSGENITINLKVKNPPLWIEVSEMNWGKYLDTCGNTSNWGVASKRVIWRPTCSAVDYAANRCPYKYVSLPEGVDDVTDMPVDLNLLKEINESGTVNRLASCQNADWAVCVEKAWDQVKIYRPYYHDTTSQYPAKRKVIQDPAYYPTSNNRCDPNDSANSDFPKRLNRDRLLHIAHCLFDDSPAPGAKAPYDDCTEFSNDTYFRNNSDIQKLKTRSGEYDLEEIRRYMNTQFRNRAAPFDDVVKATYESNIWKLKASPNRDSIYFPQDEVQKYLFNSLKGAIGVCDPPAWIEYEGNYTGHPFNDNLKEVFCDAVKKAGLSDSECN